MSRQPVSRPLARLALASVLGLGGIAAACGGADAGPPQPPPGVETVVTGTNAFEFEPADIEVDSGDRVGLVCEGSLPHNLIIETPTEDVVVAECGGLEAADGVVEVPPGDYEFFCNIPGHREAGMVGTIVVD